MSIKVDSHFPYRDELGEGPYWDCATGTLVRLDIEREVVHRLDPVTGRQHTVPVGSPPGFVVPGPDGAVVVGTGHTVLILDGPGTGTVLGELDPTVDANGFNDAKCDARGRLFGGTLDPALTPTGGFYRLAGSGPIERVFGEVAISNGLCWDDTRARLYYTDSTTQRIDVFDYDLDTGVPSDRRPFVEIPEEVGLPDGMEVDSEGGVWIALFRGAAVHRYGPDGTLSEVVTTPTSCPTSIAFGGQDLRTVYVTSSRSWLTEEQKLAEPLGGAVLTFDAGVAGRPVQIFAL